MSPQNERLRIPPQLALVQRPVWAPAQDERPQLRTADGRTLAVIEAWRPETAN